MAFIFHDQNWLAVNKPSGLSTHRAHEGELGLVEWLSLHHGIQVYICSRLDKGTSGVLLFALAPEAARKAQTIHEQGSAYKTYVFIAAKSTLKSWLCSIPLDGKHCETHFSVLREGPVYSVYKAVIRRGRTHQIRRHAAASGIPILGDEQYDGPPFTRLCLHCSVVNWPGINDVLQADPPHWFADCLPGPSQQTTCLALAERRYPFLSSITDCCRLVHRGEFSEDIAIDKYGKWLCVTGYNEALTAERLLHKLQRELISLTQVCACLGGVVKTNLRDPHKRALFGDFYSWGETVPESFYVQEHGLQFGVRLNDRQHVGLFLDQRDSRQRIAMSVQGKRVANLFAFTCSFSVCALAAGAEVVFSVDLASGCLSQGMQNVAQNQLDTAGNAKFIKEDVRKWLARQQRKKQKDPSVYLPFDVIVCDPPVFASAGKGKNFHVENEWQNLVHKVNEILAEHGMALFANNHQAGPEHFYYDTLKNVFPEVTRLSPPLDFPQVSGHASHVHIYWCHK